MADDKTKENDAGIEENKNGNGKGKMIKRASQQESLKKFLVMEDEKGEVVSLENAGLDEVISKDESELTDDERMHLYEKAMSFKGLGSNNHALLCFLGCLKGLKPSSKSTFTMLPQCLTHISEIYALAGDYQRAVEFMQGTKLYYETAIIESGLQVDKYKEMSEEKYSPLDFDPCLDEAKRANEYERLANSCLEQQKFQLALEYCGKATKLRQKAYGDEHPLTIKSLDLFTLIYAEMGKSQYSEAMSKVGDIVKQFKEEEREQEQNKIKENNGKLDENEKDNEAGKEEKENKENNDELRSEKKKPDNGKESIDSNKHNSGEKHVRFNEGIELDEGNQTDEIEEVHDDHMADAPPLPNEQLTAKMMVLFFVVSAVIAVISTFVWCYVSDSTICPRRGYFYRKAKIFYYNYLVSSDPDINYL